MVSWPRWWAALVVAAACAGGGCTICPDPFDYSGPVPDGSPPQNDFRARSGGILSLGAAPKPWPPVVQDDGQPDAGPVLADPEPEVVEAAETPAFQQTSVLVPAAAEGDATGHEQPVPAPVAADPATSALQAVSAAVGPDDVAPSISESVVPAMAVPAAAPGATVETPGWRPRRRPGG